MGRNYLWYRRGDAANTVLAAAGYNFRRLVRWLSLLLRQIFIALAAAFNPVFFTEDQLPLLDGPLDASFGAQRRRRSINWRTRHDSNV